MNDLCKRLQNVNEAGVYRLNCPLEDLRASATEGGFVVFEADMRECQRQRRGAGRVGTRDRGTRLVRPQLGCIGRCIGRSFLVPRIRICIAAARRAVRRGSRWMTSSDATISFWKLQGKAFWVFIA